MSPGCPQGISFLIYFFAFDVFPVFSSLAVLIASLTICVPSPQRLFFAMILPMDASSKVVPGGRIRAYAWMPSSSSNQMW